VSLHISLARIKSNVLQALDMLSILAASTSDSANYLAFLEILKNLLFGKTVLIAALALY
jgi:hypothetical protein